MKTIKLKIVITFVVLMAVLGGLTISYAIAEEQTPSQSLPQLEQINNVPTELFSKKDIKKTVDMPEPSLSSVFTSLGIVIMLIMGTGWLYMKLSKLNTENLFSGKFNKIINNNLKILSSLQLGPNNAIHLIEVNNKQIIVGTTPSNITLLAELDNETSKQSLDINNKEFGSQDDIMKLLIGEKVQTNNPETTSEKQNQESVEDRLRNDNIYKKYIH